MQQSPCPPLENNAMPRVAQCPTQSDTVLIKGVKHSGDDRVRRTARSRIAEGDRPSGIRLSHPSLQSSDHIGQRIQRNNKNKSHTDSKDEDGIIVGHWLKNESRKNG